MSIVFLNFFLKTLNRIYPFWGRFYNKKEKNVDKNIIQCYNVKKRKEKAIMNQHYSLKALLGNKKFIIYVLIFILISTVSLTSYVGYNEYVYRKVGICFTERNYELAEYYINSVSPSYKDAEKIKSLIHTVKNFDKTNINDYNRAIAVLDSYKGFSNVNINHFYNSFYHQVIKLYGNNSSVPLNTIPPSDTSSPSVENTSAVTFPFENVATSSSAASVGQTSVIQSSDTLIVYYVQSGEVYHINSNCRSLNNAGKILSGPVPDGRRVCKICTEG